MKNIGIGIVGVGCAGRGHLSNLRKLNIPDVWIWDIQEKVTMELAAEFGVRTSATLDEMLLQPEIEAIIIAAPNRFHAEIAIRALRAGKHVLLEKPMALHLDDARELVEAAVASGRILHIGFELRNSEFPLLVRELIANGELGTLISGQVIHYRGHFWPPWKGRQSDGGDMYLMEDCHVIDLFRWWTGDEVETVHAIGSRKNIVEHYEYPDTQFSTFVFRNGFVGHIMDCHARAAFPAEYDPADKATAGRLFESQFGHQYEYSLVGEKGALRFLPLSNECHIYRHKREGDGSMWQRLVRTVKFPNYSKAIHNDADQMRIFLDVVAGRQAAPITPMDAFRTHLACFAARRAQISGQPVKPDYDAVIAVPAAEPALEANVLEALVA